MQPLDPAYTYTSPERPTIFGLRQSALVEIFLLLAVMLFLDIVAFDHTRYWDVNPHPFWLIVLFISCKYGTGRASSLHCFAARPCWWGTCRSIR